MQVNCPNCAGVINIEFDKNEATRRVPCMHCYHERPQEKFQDTEIPVRQLDGEIKNEMRNVPVMQRDAGGSLIIDKFGAVLDISADGAAVIAAKYG